MTTPFFVRPSPNHQTPNNECDSDGHLCGQDVGHLINWDLGQRDGGGGCDIYELLEARKEEADYPEGPVSNQTPSHPYASRFRGLPQTVSILLLP